VILALACAREPELTVVGDVVLARGVADEIARRGDPWAALPLGPGEVRVGNLEGSVAVGDCEGICLGFQEAALDRLRDAGFRAMSVENNHAHDHGGREATLEGLRRRGIAPIAAGSPVSLAGWGLVAIDLSGSGFRERLEQGMLDIATASASDARVMVLPHWGDEGSARIRPVQADIAATFRAWGATAVVGAGAHVPGPVECGTWYNLGNHLMDQAPADSWTGLAVTCAGTVCRTWTTQRTERSVFPAFGESLGRCALSDHPVDLAWKVHSTADRLIAPARLPEAGPDAWFALRRLPSTFDDLVGLRPYVFDARGERVKDRWRGTALSHPIALAAVVDGGLCALLRGDSFLAPDPANQERTWTSWRWNGFGFSSSGDAGRCAEALDPSGLLATD
jgi:hypothetical protein